MVELTQEYVLSLFNYEDGHLFWKVRRRGIKLGAETGWIRKDGYRQTKIDGKLYLTHRIIYLYHKGYLPDFLDHVDSNRINNKIKNLRPVTKSQNAMHRTPRRNCSSVYKGVTWHKRDKIYEAYVAINGKQKHLGYFKNEIDAAKAYNEAATEMFGEFACLNIIDASKRL